METDKMKFTRDQWRLYQYLKAGDNASFEEAEWVQKNFPLASSSGKSYARCPLCGYETNSTNVHRHCPLAPLLLNEKFFNGERLAVYQKLASLNMVDVVGQGQQKNGYVPRGWKDLQWRRDITPEEWDKIIEKQDFVKVEKEED
jgi:hypothetical protein